MIKIIIWKDGAEMLEYNALEIVMAALGQMLFMAEIWAFIL